MKPYPLIGFLVAMIALSAFASMMATPVKAQATTDFVKFDNVVVDGVDFDVFGLNSNPQIDVIAGSVIPIRVTFSANPNAPNDTFPVEETTVSARILGESGTRVETSEFAVLTGGHYSRILNLEIPSDLDDELEESFVLEITVESRFASGDAEFTVDLLVQRASDLLEILAIEADQEVGAGDILFLDVVVKNLGREESRETFIRASIPELGISRMTFIRDLDAKEGDDPDRDDSAVGRIALQIPDDAPAGVHTVEVEAFNDETRTVRTIKVVVVGASEESVVVTSAETRSFGVDDAQTYSLTVVNAGDTIKVYELSVESASGVSVDLEESVFAVPAGLSKTVLITVRSSQEGTHNFAINVNSGGELIDQQNFIALVNGDGGNRTTGGNAAVVLTIILAIIFVVLLIVLIVLLTRKPEKSEEYGESYY